MPRPSCPSQHQVKPQSRTANVVPLFVCPGFREVPLDCAVFPHGSGFSKPVACPGRDICVWFAAHDLGGTTAFGDLPAGGHMGAMFSFNPFRCPNFLGENCVSACRPNHHIVLQGTHVDSD